MNLEKQNKETILKWYMEVATQEFKGNTLNLHIALCHMGLK